MKVQLVKDTIDKNDIDNLIEWLKTNPKLTKGEYTEKFEKLWSDYIGVKYSIYVNSGSSANLAMAYALKLSNKVKNNIVIAPSVSWVTTVSPFIQLGYDVKLVDCDKETLGPDIEHLKSLIKIYNPGILIFVHVLGFPSKMKEIKELCEENNIILLEDSCESVGSTYNNIKTGSFGLMSSFSFYFGHHLSVLGDTPIPYINENNEFKLDYIKDIYENYKNFPNNIKIISFDKNNSLKYTSPYNIIKHNLNNKKLLELKLEYDRKVIITEDHSVFSYENNDIINKRGIDIRIGDDIIVPSKLPRPEIINKLRFIDYCKNIKNKFFVIETGKSKKRTVLPLELLLNETHNLRIGKKNTPKYKYIPIEYNVSPDLCRLIGYYIAKGFYEKSSICLSFNKNEREYSDDVKDIIKNIFNIDTHEIDNYDNGITIKVSSEILKIFFEDFLNIDLKTSNQRIPSFIFSSNDECISSFLYGYFTGNGTRTDEKKINITSFSKKFINDISYLFSLMGYNGSTVDVKQENSDIKIEELSIQYKFILSDVEIKKKEIIGKQNNIKNKINEDLSLLKVKTINTIDTDDDFVYDFCVKDDENFVGGWQPICLHNSTIEGGMVCTNDDYLFNVLKSIRAHGWGRDLDFDFKSILKETHPVDDFKDLYTFYYPGFNLRSTDLQAFIGIGQMNKIDNVVETRNKNYLLYHELIKNEYWKINPTEESYVSAFAYPIITPKIDKLIEALKINEIETRPLICGSINKQPFWINLYGKSNDLIMSNEVDKFGCYLPNNHQLSIDDIEFVCDVVNKNI